MICLKEVQQVVSTAGGEDFVSVDAIPGRALRYACQGSSKYEYRYRGKDPGAAGMGEGTQSLAVLTLFNAYLQAWNKGAPYCCHGGTRGTPPSERSKGTLETDYSNPRTENYFNP